MPKKIAKQGTRSIVLVIYVIVLFCANYLAFGSILPPTTAKGLWFYSGLASVLLGNLLVTPFFTKPVDAISYSVVAGIALYSVNAWSNWMLFDKVLFVLSLAFCFSILCVSFIAILTKDSTSKVGQEWSNTLRVISDAFGNQTIVFSLVIIFALIVFHRSSSKEMFVITLVWVLTVILKPEEFIFNLHERIKKIWSISFPSSVIGDIVAYQTPGVALIRQRVRESIPFGTPLFLKDSHAPAQIGISIGYVGRDESLLVRTITFEVPKEIENRFDSLCRIIPDDTVARCDHLFKTEEVFSRIPILREMNNFVGIVATDTSIEHLYFEVIQEMDLEEGKLVEVSIKGTPVIYQVIDGLTKEEIVYQKNTFGYARAKAQKIGVWDEDDKKFIPAKWIPNLNAPVILKSSCNYTPEVNAIGHFPGSNYNVLIKDINHFVTHNTAILGILGVGKSMLSIELVERIIAENIKVICIDLTNQYANELSEFINIQEEEKNQKEIQDIGIRGRGVCCKNVEDGGSINQFADAIKSDLNNFISADCPCMLKIYNPSKFEVWRQDSKPYQGEASMASLTPTEIAQIISEAALEIAQELGMTDHARICLVYEEAHSLVPEWNSVVAEGDKSATNGTARAILQGRKYGLGCLLITQRTANVTKTILNQCNTIFAMRTFDDTGKDFLSNYIGKDYAAILPSLQERHAVFFGKASSCDNPVLIRLNDRDDFKRIFRANYSSKRIKT